MTRYDQLPTVRALLEALDERGMTVPDDVVTDAARRVSITPVTVDIAGWVASDPTSGPDLADYE